MALHTDQHDREDHQHQDVERQDIEEGRLELQQQRLDHGDMRFVEEVADPHLLIVHRVLERRDGVGHLGDEDHEQKNMRNIELPGAAQYLGGGIDDPFVRQPAGIDQGGCESRNEDENFRGIEESECLQGEVTENIFRDVVNEDEDQRHPAEEI